MFHSLIAAIRSNYSGRSYRRNEMIVSPHCNKHDMAIRLLTLSHCEKRHDDECEYGLCDHFGMRFYSKLGF